MAVRTRKWSREAPGSRATSARSQAMGSAQEWTGALGDDDPDWVREGRERVEGATRRDMLGWYAQRQDGRNGLMPRETGTPFALEDLSDNQLRSYHGMQQKVASTTGSIPGMAASALAGQVVPGVGTAFGLAQRPLAWAYGQEMERRGLMPTGEGEPEPFGRAAQSGPVGQMNQLNTAPTPPSAPAEFKGKGKSKGQKATARDINDAADALDRRERDRDRADLSFGGGKDTSSVGGALGGPSQSLRF